MIPEGTYKIRGVDAALGYSGNDNEQVAVELVLLDGGEGVEGRRITWYGSFTEKMTDRTLESLRLLGWEGDDLSDLSGIGEREAYAVIAHEEDLEGNLRARVKWINAGGGVALKQRMDEGSAKAFAERMKGHVLAQKQRKQPAATSGNARRPVTNKSAPRATAAAAGLPNDDDDQIPF